MGTGEITVAAIQSYRRLAAVRGRRLGTHGCADGGLICEDRTNPYRPALWRIGADGAVLADTRYSFPRRAFVRPPAAQPV